MCRSEIRPALEWAQYADLVAQQLTGRGYVRVTKPADAKYAVLFSYAIDRGKTTTTAVPVFGQTGGGVTTFYSGSGSGFAYTQPTYGEVGSDLITTTTFTRALELEIFDVPAFETEIQKQYRIAACEGIRGRRWERRTWGKFGSGDARDDRCGIQDFPGKSGETISVSAPLHQ